MEAVTIEIVHSSIDSYTVQSFTGVKPDEWWVSVS